MKAKTLDDVYRAHMREIYQYLLQLSKHPQDAEDLMQDTFVKAYEYLDSYDGGKVRPWLFRVAFNAYVDRCRKEKKQLFMDPSLLEETILGSEPGPEEDYLSKERVLAWIKGVAALPEKSKQVIVLRDYYDFTYEDISVVLGISLANVKVTLYRARQRMKEVLNNEM